ncbi:thioredoxin-like protein [Zopfia rhizophila CBS 207.26]|uniref:Thioredoxin-like protein n=1 Tax=Zopfia rhizophila CBS 207.26 TaxID=1314779 RepID=A0A6A6EBR1_9PEZI|nr:thioredoxin-like protein [Zopfia rhizophila CBS 207.26]
MSLLHARNAGSLGKIRVGHKTLDFHCEVVVKGEIQGISRHPYITLSTYINPTKSSGLILLFIPAAFSFVCPTKVLAFQNCLDEFSDRNSQCASPVWRAQKIDVHFLSDARHKISRDYGASIEEERVCLRRMFILDNSVVTLTILIVGCSILEVLRLLEAFQAVAKHGVPCPIGWKPSNSTSETINTISNTLAESYVE